MVHRYKLGGYNIAVDTFSGSVHCVDELAYDVIGLYESAERRAIEDAMLEKYADSPEITRGEVRAVFDDVAELEKNGRLFSKDVYKDLAPPRPGRGHEIKALCLHVSHACNLDCSYCFASQGKYHGERALMPLEVAKRAIDFLIENSGERVNLEVDFFGGEPLMNWDTVKQTVAYARQIEASCGKNFRFTLTTNGMLLDDEVIDFANREMHNVVLSLDGRRQVHDRFRKTAHGEGSYDRIVPLFRELVDRRGGKDYYVRGTFTHFNTDFTKDILHMADLGFTELSMEPVVCAADDPCALTDDDLPILFEQYERLAGEMLRRGDGEDSFTFYHYTLDLTGGPCIHKRIAGCGSGSEYFAVTPGGDLYPCHQFVGHSSFCMGTVWEGIVNTALRDEFSSLSAFSRPECRQCWAQLYCSGGCAANAYHAAGSINGVYEYGCHLFRKRVECAIMLQVARALSKAR